MFKKQAPKVSVCIPVFGTENFLAGCLESVAAQNFDGIEIIVTDDSNPKTKKEKIDAEQIVKRFKKNHKKEKISVKFIKHGKNKGLLEARRSAVYEADGDFIMFLDSDDNLPPGAIKSLYDAALKTGADIVQGKADFCVRNSGSADGKTFLNENDKKRAEEMEKEANKIFKGELSGRKIFDGFLVESNHSGFLWGKIFTRKLCLEAFDKIPPAFCIFGEDFLTYFFLSFFAEKYFGTEEKVYRYSIDTGISSSKKITSLEEWKKICSTASVFTILLGWANSLELRDEGRCGETSPLEGEAENADAVGARGRLSPLDENEKEKLRGICCWYAMNNIAQLKKSVAPELQEKAYEMLCDFWGEKMIKSLENL